MWFYDLGDLQVIFMRFKDWLTILILFFAGLVCGSCLFSQSLPRNILPFEHCKNHCYTNAEIAGLVTSAAILQAPFLLPSVVLESDTCLAIRNPRPEARIHYVLFPKHDTKNITTLTPVDTLYVLGCFNLARELVTKDSLQAYKLYTNGPGLQEIAYLHFHLVAQWYKILVDNILQKFLIAQKIVQAKRMIDLYQTVYALRIRPKLAIWLVIATSGTIVVRDYQATITLTGVNTSAAKLTSPTTSVNFEWFWKNDSLCAIRQKMTWID